MHRLGIRTGADLREWSRISLVREFGKAGNLYYGYARGEDLREVTPHRERKSLGAELTFYDDISDMDRLHQELDALQKEVWTRVKRHDFLGKSAVVKIKFSDFQQITRSKTMPTAFQSLDELQTVSNEILDSVELDGRKVRLLGLTVGNSSRHCSECVQLCFDFD